MAVGERPGEHSEADDEVNRHRKDPNKQQTYLSDRTANVIISVVTAMWALNVVAGVAVKYTGYQPSDVIHGIFLGIVGGAFALKNQRKD